MASIIELIKNIRNARLGKDVRESIASAIEQTYEDATEKGSSNMEVAQARGAFNTLRERLNNSDTVKADKLEVQRQINSLASGSPLVASSVSEMTDTTRVYVNTTDGYWYTYDGSSWVARGKYQSTGIEDNSVTVEKTDFFNSIGLIPLNFIKGFAYSNGNPVVFNNGCYSPKYIEVTGNENIYATKTYDGLWLNFYDENKVYLSNFNMNYYKKTIPTNAKYVRFNITTDKFSSLPNDFIQIYTETTLKNMSNLFLKAKLNNNYNEINSEDVIINESKIAILQATYREITNVEVNKNNFKGLVNIENPEVKGIRFKHNLKVGDILQIELKENTMQLAGMSLYNENTQQLGRFTLENNKGSILITENIFNSLTPTLFISEQFPAGVNNIDITISVKNDFYNLQDFINYVKETKMEKKYKGMFLGDSITALSNERSWINYFNEIIPMSNIINVSVAGAQLKDTSPNQQYDGNPVYFPNNPDNVLGNQVQKIINNNYETPDFIFIAIGTNGGIRVSSENDIFNVYYDENNNLISLQNVDRTTDAGAFRYCQETLHNLYPSAIIVWCTPIQAVQPTSGSAVSMRTVKNILLWGNNLKQFTSVASCICIDTEKCGINGVNEIEGQNGEFLQDGLHPNANGAKQMGYYNACEFKKILDRINV